jgi:hypothetical protein
MYFDFYSSGNKRIITRTYPKVVSTLGEIGGNREIILVLGLILYRLYNSIKYDKFKKKEVL